MKYTELRKEILKRPYYASESGIVDFTKIPKYYTNDSFFLPEVGNPDYGWTCTCRELVADFQTKSTRFKNQYTLEEIQQKFPELFI